MLKRNVIFLLLFLVGCHNDELLVENLSQKQAIEVLVLLNEHGISAQKKRQQDRKANLYNINLAKKNLPHALKILHTNNLPKNISSGYYDIFIAKNQNMIPSKSDDEAKYCLAKQGEIEQLLMTMPNICEAKVVLTLAKDNSAAVSLVTYEDVSKDEKVLKEEIKDLVANAIGKIEKEHIFIAINSIIPLNRPLDKMKFIKKEESSVRNILTIFLLSIVIFSLLYLLLTMIRKKLFSKVN